MGLAAARAARRNLHRRDSAVADGGHGCDCLGAGNGGSRRKHASSRRTPASTPRHSRHRPVAYAPQGSKDFTVAAGRRRVLRKGQNISTLPLASGALFARVKTFLLTSALAGGATSARVEASLWRLRWLVAPPPHESTDLFTSLSADTQEFSSKQQWRRR